MFSPKRSHKLALTRLVNFLKKTYDHGLLLYPNYDIYVELYEYV